MRILVTGVAGFIGKNLHVRLTENGHEVLGFYRGDSIEKLGDLVRMSDVIVHLAGENRPENDSDFQVVNTDLTIALCESIRGEKRRIPLILASSIQAAKNNPYGRSKKDAEIAVERLAEDTGNPVIVYRLPGVFGKWCRPNYNSVVATFCHNVVNDIPLEVHTPDKVINLVYIDDVVEEFSRALFNCKDGISTGSIAPEYSISLSDLADTVAKFKSSRNTLVTERVGVGIVRALYSTYVSYYPESMFVYDIPSYNDGRGMFAEVLKTHDSGQFSFFTAARGITRGEHYHHSKTEKFLVLQGCAKFSFRHLISDSVHEIITTADKPQIVETIPGWVHNIKNIGEKELIVMLWANEIFDKNHQDTYSCKV